MEASDNRLAGLRYALVGDFAPIHQGLITGAMDRAGASKVSANAEQIHVLFTGECTGIRRQDILHDNPGCWSVDDLGQSRLIAGNTSLWRMLDERAARERYEAEHGQRLRAYGGLISVLHQIAYKKEREHYGDF